MKLDATQPFNDPLKLNLQFALLTVVNPSLYDLSREPLVSRIVQASRRMNSISGYITMRCPAAFN